MLCIRTRDGSEARLVRFSFIFQLCFARMLQAFASSPVELRSATGTRPSKRRVPSATPSERDLHRDGCRDASAPSAEPYQSLASSQHGIEALFVSRTRPAILLIYWQEATSSTRARIEGIRFYRPLWLGAGAV